MPACLVIIQGATMGVEISLLPSFGLWTDSLHGFVLAAGMVLTPLTGVVVLARVYRYALTALVWLLGK
ncbi:hypothetical protein EGJ28_20450 [Stutzerimonas xanthomarina]|jgi:hypothetical protein|uniref:Uncharacterized protein n=2 Tax=Stutzerimonas TaxID=2901164 RepID=A0A0D7DZD7_STUST|nr:MULTISPECIES: hypothetical protein [Stutzerimonas]MCH2339032.1 hypothetical protein [Pseudomonas sp.]WAD28814.1 hypothetical protein OS670_21195 [Pseudomonadaceae bacterium T75]KIZ33636.1 hypothetical protein LO50_19950 [Stutzerimonas stutzeri]KZX56215.1 hypothetical protein A3710_21930 [Stutzerimonas frequens]MBH3355448.1 hypothetical protein [Stutzerimonas stutzeri]